MSTAQFTVPLITVIPGQLITASLWNNEYDNLFTNLNPLGIGAYSDTDAQMQTSTDPFPAGSTSRPTSIGGEIERIRYILGLIIGQTYWYQHPTIDLATAKTDIVALEGSFPIQSADIGNLQVTTAKIAANAVTNAQIANNTIGAGQIANASITETQLSASVAGSGLSGGAGSVLSVNVDNSTLDIPGDTLEVKDLGITGDKIAAGTITSNKLDSGVPAAVGLKSIQNFTVTVTYANTQTSVTTNTTISSVNTAKAVAVVTSIELTNTGGIVVKKYTVSLTTATNLATTVVLTSGSSGSSTVTVLVTVLEFN